MDTTKIIDLLSYTLPSLVTGGVAYYLFNSYFKDQQHTRRWLSQKETQKQALPLRLQAYERLSLFLERINPSQLLLRIAPPSTSKQDYATLLAHQIQTEFEHNLTQQIYVTAETWNMILKAKNSTVQMIRKNAIREDIADANKLREAIMIELTEVEAPSSIAISFIKEELKNVL